jgi:catechol 2,3-dioxygenase-like lactoylglutathione lyase family enzyme
VEIERVDFLSIASQDIERSRRFYLETLGLPLDRDVPGSGGFEVWAGDLCLSVWEPEKMGLRFAPNPNHIALRVADVEEARRELEGRGVEFQGETLDTSVCHMAFFEDPDGNALMLHRRYAS